MSTNKNKKKSGIAVKVISLLIGAVIGFFLGELLGGELAKNKEFPVSVLLLFLYIFVVFFAIVIIHEAGHLVMGLATGYKFVSFRIGTLTFVKEDGAIKFRRYNIEGTGGQCLMMPPESETPENLPFFWYHFGGGFFNLMTAAICGIIMLFTDNNIAEILLGFAALLSLVMGLMNLIPVSMPLANDGKNIVTLKKSPDMRVVLYRQLYINGLLYQGKLPREIPEKLFESVGDSEMLGVHKCVMPMLQASLMVDKKNFKGAEPIFAAIVDDEENIELYRNECASELMFCKIMNGAPAEEIDELYDKNLKSYVKQMKSMHIAKRRLMYAYYLICEKDVALAEKEYEAAQKMRKTYPCRGELESELELIEYVKSRYSSGKELI